MEQTIEKIKREIIIHAPLEKVWDALTKPEHLNRWYTKDVQIDFRVGGRGEMDHGWGATSSGIFTEIENQKRFVLQSDDGIFSTTTVLEERGNGVLVSIEYQSLQPIGEAGKENMAFGTSQFLENLKSVYEQGIDNRPNMWKSWLGIVHTSHVLDENVYGSRVIQVGEHTSAATAGIMIDDIILQLDEQLLSGYESLEKCLHDKQVGQVVDLTLQRGNKQITVSCEIAPYPVSY